MTVVLDCFRVAPVDGKGLGAKATCAIEKGSRILAEAPLIQLSGKEQAKWNTTLQTFMASKQAPPDFEACLLQKLDEAGSNVQEGFWSLSDAYASDDRKTATGVWHTNSFALGSETKDAMGVLCRASRFNHSCTPNLTYNWQDELGQHVFHAARDIQPGEDLTISYIPLANIGSVRREKTTQIYQFNCDCACCCLAGEALRMSNARRTRLSDLVRSIHELLVMSEISTESAQHGLRAAIDLNSVIDEELEGNPFHKAQAYCLGAKVAMMASLVDELDTMSSKAYEQIAFVVGPEGEWYRFFGVLPDEEEDDGTDTSPPSNNLQHAPKASQASDSYIPTALKTNFRKSAWAPKSSALSFPELRDLLKRGQPDMSDDDVQELFDKVDKDATGKIHFDALVDFLYR